MYQTTWIRNTSSNIHELSDEVAKNNKNSTKLTDRQRGAVREKNEAATDQFNDAYKRKRIWIISRQNRDLFQKNVENVSVWPVSRMRTSVCAKTPIYSVWF